MTLHCQLLKIFKTRVFTSILSCTGKRFNSASRKVKIDYDIFSSPSTDLSLTPIVISHGLYGGKKDWLYIGKELSNVTNRKVICYDAVNHGSSASHEKMSYLDMAHDLVILLENLRITKISCIGHRMGGKTLMTLALAQPERIEQMAIIDIVPNTEVFSENSVENLKKVLNIDLTKFKSKHELEEHFRYVELNVKLMRSILINISETNDTLNWNVDVCNVLNNYSQVLSFPSFHQEITFNGSALFVTGFKSLEVFFDGFPWIYKRFPSAKIQYLPELDRWLHMENPDRLMELFEEFFNQSVSK